MNHPVRVNGPVMCVNHPERFAFEVFNDRGLCRSCYVTDRARLADEIVRAVAKCDPIVREYDGRDGRNHCAFCVSDGGRPDAVHAADCPWLLSVKYAEGK